MDINQIGGYYSRFDTTKEYDRHLFRAGKVLQSAELNELQQAEQQRLKSIADALFKDGDVIRDAQAVINADTGEAICEAGAVYLAGAVRGVPQAEFVIPTEGIVTIGIYLQESVITELEDPALRDPATGTRNYEEPGAVRLKISPRWGHSGDGQNGQFYPVYTVEDGVLRAKEPPPNLDAFTQALAKYDRDSAGGTYVVDGMLVAQSEDTAEGKQVYTVTEGRARVNGYGVEFQTSRRLVYDAQPDALFIDAEPHMSAGTDAQRVNTDRNPIGEITQVRITTERTVEIVHAGFTGASDPLPDNSVLSILSVTQGSTTYANGDDYRLTAGQVDWSPGGAEPAPGSTYTVTYRYIATVAPMNADDKGFTVTGAVAESLILVSYNYLLPRIDRLILNPDGALQWVKGVAAQWNPVLPYVAPGLLPLATIVQTWDANHRLINDSVRTVKMDQLWAVSARLDHILALIAQQRLEASANMIEAGMKKSLLVDPFLDDSLRDAGVEQDALILGEELQLFIEADALQLVGDIQTPRTLEYTDVAALAQTLKTGDMRINPYDAFAAIPNQVTLNPAFDNWTTRRTVGSTQINTTIGTGNASSIRTSTSFALTGTSEELDTMRSINVGFTIRGWDANETVAEVHFDGIVLTPNNSAGSAAGVTTGSFLIPPEVPAGRKSVQFVGSAASFAETTYEGSQTILDQWETVHRITQQFVRNTDPLAQTFTLPETCQIAAVDLWFTATGPGQIVAQIRGVSNGVPTQEVHAQSYVDPGSILTNGNPTRVRFDAPAYLTAGESYAIVVLCDDAEAKLALAELGKYDISSDTFVTSQPYQIGVMLSSSNAATWTAHQDKDLAFRLLRATYTQTARAVALGAVQVEDATDLILLSPASRPETPARVSYRLTLPAAEGPATQIVVDSGQRVQLAQAISGEVTVEALLSGLPAVAPIVWPGSQLVTGKIAEAGTYVTRAILAGQNSSVKVIFDAVIPAGAAVTPAISGIDESDGWQAMTLEKMQNMDEGFRELTYTVSGVNELMIRARLTLTGTPAARPRVKNLRIIVT